MKRNQKIAAYILAGGFSSRMGREKGLLEFGGVPLIVRTFQTVEPLVGEVTIIGPPDRYTALGLRVIPDQQITESENEERIQTPVAGIATALTVTTCPWNLILACDLPYLTADWLDWLLARALTSDAQIVMPHSAAGPEPLAAMYRKECASAIVAALQGGVRKVTDAMSKFRMERVSENEWAQHDPQGRVLRNMNTPEDYEAAKNGLKKDNRD